MSNRARLFFFITPTLSVAWVSCGAWNRVGRGSVIIVQGARVGN